MNPDLKESFIELLEHTEAELPDRLTLGKISSRGKNFRRTEKGKIRFDIVRHPPLDGRPGSEFGSPARWHASKTYTINPETMEWKSRFNNVEFHYDIPRLVEEEKDMIVDSGLLEEAIQKNDDIEDMLELIIDRVIPWYEEYRPPPEDPYHIEDEVWDNMM